MRVGLFLDRNQFGAKIINGSILALAICGWCLLGRVPLTAPSIAAVFIFCIGIVSWASICSILWPSRCSLNTYLPYGFALCSLASFILIMLKQGTVVSCMIASLSGSIFFGLGKVFSTQKQHNNNSESSEAKITTRSTSLLVTAALITTFLLADQLTSIANLSDTSVNTTIRGWSDVILHANTVLSLSSLGAGQPPISTLNYTDRIIPYHYASYILSAVVSSLSPQANPLASYVTIVAPFGCFLLLLPLSEHIQTCNSRYATFTILGTGSILFLVYSLWVRLIGNSSFDPAWLLITAPATMYGCAQVLSGVQIGTTAHNRGPASIVSLSLLTFLLTAFSKIQIAHALLPMLVIITTAGAFRIPRRKSERRINQWIYLPVSLISLAAVHLYGNSILGIRRSHPVQEVMTFFGEISAMTWDHANFGVASVANNDWTAPLIGLLTLCGPLFLIAMIISLRRPSKDKFRVKVLILVAISYGISLLLSPSMPWDDREFLNRSWPLLWCVGAWALLGRCPIKSEHQQHPQKLIIGSAIAVAIGWIILPESKKESIASPPRREDWTKTYYPISINSNEKKLAQELKRLDMHVYFFASSSTKNSNSILDDLPSRLAALSGVRPLLSRLSFQKSLPVPHSKSGMDLSVNTRYNQMLNRYGAACPSSASETIPIKEFKQPGAAPNQKVYVVCQGLEQPSP